MHDRRCNEPTCVDCRFPMDFSCYEPAIVGSHLAFTDEALVLAIMKLQVDEWVVNNGDLFQSVLLATNLEDGLRAVGYEWSPKTREVRVVHEYDREFDDRMWTELAPYIQPGSYIDMMPGGIDDPLVLRIGWQPDGFHTESFLSE